MSFSRITWTELRALRHDHTRRNNNNHNNNKKKSTFSSDPHMPFARHTPTSPNNSYRYCDLAPVEEPAVVNGLAGLGVTKRNVVIVENLKRLSQILRACLHRGHKTKGALNLLWKIDFMSPERNHGACGTQKRRVPNELSATQ